MFISQCESCFSPVLLTRLVKIAHPGIATGKCMLGLKKAEGRTIAVAMECNGSSFRRLVLSRAAGQPKNFPDMKLAK